MQTLPSPRSAEPLKEASVIAESNKPSVRAKPRWSFVKVTKLFLHKNNQSNSANTINEKFVSADINNGIHTPSDFNEMSVLQTIITESLCPCLRNKLLL